MNSIYNKMSSYTDNGDMFIRINLGQTKYDKKPNGEQIAKEHCKMKEQTISLTEFCEAIREGRMFIAANFIPDENGKVNHRKQNFYKSSLIVMDVDSGDYTIDEVLEFLNKNDIAPNVIYKSFSYTDEFPRFRIIWVIGEVGDIELMSDISTLTYELLKKWTISNKTKKNKKVPHLSKEKQEGDYDYYVQEDDKSSSNITQMWQGTNKEVYLIHQNYVNIADFVNVFYSLTSKGHANRITEILKNTCNIGAMGWLGSREYKDISSNYYEPRGKISQLNVNNKGVARTERIDVWGFKGNLKKDVRKPKIELVSEHYGNSDETLLFNRCQLMRELSKPGKHWIENGGYQTKFKICTNLKFIKDGQDLMYRTICQHSDRGESAWNYTFDRINTSFPPVPCSEFCPYAESCKYGRSSIAFAAQKNAYNYVASEHKVKEISLDEAQKKTEKAIEDTMNVHEKYREIYKGWEEGVNRKYHHIGLDEYRDELVNIKKELHNLFYDIKNAIDVYDDECIDMFEFNNDFNAIKKYIISSSIPSNMKDNLKEKIDSLVSRMNKNSKAKEDIDQKRFELRQKINIISVPVGGGKTRALINEIANNYERLYNAEICHIPHVAYAAPSHMLAEQFESELYEAMNKRNIDKKNIAKANIVRLTPRPTLPFIRDEAEIQNLEKLGLSISDKLNKFINTYEELLEIKKFDKDKEDEVKSFIYDAEKFKENRKQAKKANILITTHAYIQKSLFPTFDNIDIVYFDEDICKTATDTFSLSVSQIIKMKDNIANSTYGDGFEFTDLVDICDYMLKAPNNKVITFDSENFLCSQIKIKGKIEVVDYITEDKALELSSCKRRDKVDYFKLCNIKSFIRIGDKFIISSYNKINIGDKPLVMLSANPSSVEVLKKITGRNDVEVCEIGYIKQKGKIIQYPNIGACRGNLEDEEYVEKIKELIKRDNPECKEVITYKNNMSSFSEFNTTLHMGATSGINKISGQNIAVVGTYHVPPITVNLFSAMFDEDGTIRDLELPKYRKVDYKGIEQKISTYSRGIMREYHLWYIYDEMIQAVGRARAVRRDTTVSIFCQLQNPQAKIYNDEIIVKFNDTDRDKKMAESIEKISTNEQIDIESLPIEY